MAPATHMTRMSSQEGQVSAKFRAKKVAKMPPMVIWPSTPMFQNFILKAGAMARDAPSKGMAILMVCWMASLPPKLPPIMAP